MWRRCLNPGCGVVLLRRNPNPRMSYPVVYPLIIRATSMLRGSAWRSIMMSYFSFLSLKSVFRVVSHPFFLSRTNHGGSRNMILSTCLLL